MNACIKTKWLLVIILAYH